MNRLHILLPGLRPDFSHLTDEVLAIGRGGALATLLGRGREMAAPEGGVEDRLGTLFQLPREPDWPFAPLSLAAEGVDPGGDYWLRADPVQLLLMLDHLRLGEAPALRREEADALVAGLNAEFAGEAAFFAPHPQRWYARFERPLRVRTTPPGEVAGQSIREALPAGEDGRRLIRLMNEIQIWLHAQPLNARREAEGLPPVNSLWFWGGGGAVPVRARLDHVLADDPLAQALAAAAGLPWQPLPERLEAAELPPGTGLVLLDSLRGPARLGDRTAWRTAWERLAADWFQPLLAAAGRGRWAEVIVESLDTPAQARCLGRFDVWRVWRRPHWPPGGEVGA